MKMWASIERRFTQPLGDCALPKGISRLRRVYTEYSFISSIALDVLQCRIDFLDKIRMFFGEEKIDGF
jgi:hypothetical protein